jgi:hypothetical protein
MAAGKGVHMLLTLPADYTYYAPSIWDWLTLALLETTCTVFLIVVTFWLPLSDWLMRRRMRKRAEYRRKLRQMHQHQQRYEIACSKWQRRTHPHQAPCSVVNSRYACSPAIS